MARKCFILMGMLLLAWAFGPSVSAQTLNKDMVWKVNRPVALPEKVLLPGTYSVRFIDPNCSVVAVRHQDGTALGFYLVRRAPEQARAADEARITIGFLSDGTKAVKEWIYPGDFAAFEFVYAVEQPVVFR
jgi:hypothetical protein